jgi:hypothetical protein
MMLPGATPLWAGDNILGSPSLRPAEAVELGIAARSLEEVKQAVRGFEKRDFDRCLALLAEARKAPPELAPADALFAKLAFLLNQGPLIRPALERAVVADPDHPETYPTPPIPSPAC